MMKVYWVGELMVVVPRWVSIGRMVKAAWGRRYFG